MGRIRNPDSHLMSLSLLQIELDKENDYYMRPASPAHTHDPYAEDDPYLEAVGSASSSSDRKSVV